LIQEVYPTFETNGVIFKFSIEFASTCQINQNVFVFFFILIYLGKGLGFPLPFGAETKCTPKCVLKEPLKENLCISLNGPGS
jgi:hypothetical protein